MYQYQYLHKKNQKNWSIRILTTIPNTALILNLPRFRKLRAYRDLDSCLITALGLNNFLTFNEKTFDMVISS